MSRRLGAGLANALGALILIAPVGCIGGEECGGIAGLPCAPGFYCKYEDGTCGAADQTGACMLIHRGPCIEIYAPVCGCDDQTYDNSCFAAAEGVSILHEGECEVDDGEINGQDGDGDRACGGLQGLACRDGEYCRFADGECGAADQTGVCTENPEACTEEFMPVCGCDGLTYSNRCNAAAAGISIVAAGECEGSGDDQKPCGGNSGLTCDGQTYCRYDDGVCGQGETSGLCTEIPQVCTEEFAPVCGCDGLTYDNRCFASAAGASVRADGACDEGGGEPQGRACGGIAGLPCAEGEYCRLNVGECCCDFLGVCEAVPEVCTEEFAPVCGCDGNTYDNQCFAARAALSIDHLGGCE